MIEERKQEQQEHQIYGHLGAYSTNYLLDNSYIIVQTG